MYTCWDADRECLSMKAICTAVGIFWGGSCIESKFGVHVEAFPLPPLDRAQCVSGWEGRCV